MGDMGGIGGMGGMGGTGGRAGTAVASAGRGQGPAGNNNRVEKQRHGPGRHQRMRNTVAEDMFQRLIMGGFLRRDEAGNLLPITAPAPPGANTTGTGDNLGGGIANTGANSQATGATGGNLPSGAVAGPGGNNHAPGNAANAGGNTSGEMEVDVDPTDRITEERPVPLHRDERERGEEAFEEALPKPTGRYRAPHYWDSRGGQGGSSS